MKKLLVLAAGAVLLLSGSPPAKAATTYTIHAPGGGASVFAWMQLCDASFLSSPTNGVDGLVAIVPSQYVGKVMPIKWTAAASVRPPSPAPGPSNSIVYLDATCRHTGEPTVQPNPPLGSSLSGTVNAPVPPGTKYVAFHNWSFVEWTVTF